MLKIYIWFLPNVVQYGNGTMGPYFLNVTVLFFYIKDMSVLQFYINLKLGIGEDK